jgi:hypothetical protein
MSNVGNVAFAARDRLWHRISKLTELNEFIASRWPVRRGPLGGAVSVFCELGSHSQTAARTVAIPSIRNHCRRVIDVLEMIISTSGFAAESQRDGPRRQHVEAISVPRPQGPSVQRRILLIDLPNQTSWDACTGLGSPNGTKCASAITGNTPSKRK